MSVFSRFRHAMMNWNRFITASILVGALLLKVGVPLLAVIIGLGSAAFINWQMRPRGVTHV